MQVSSPQSIFGGEQNDCGETESKIGLSFHKHQQVIESYMCSGNNAKDNQVSNT